MSQPLPRTFSVRINRAWFITAYTSKAESAPPAEGLTDRCGQFNHQALPRRWVGVVMTEGAANTIIRDLERAGFERRA